MERQNLPAEPDFSLIIVGADAEAEKRAANRDMVQAEMLETGTWLQQGVW